jgi:putative oxidoreductase
MKPFMQKMLTTTAPHATLLVRVMVGGVFLFEGLQKFLFSEALGAGRLARIGFPAPEVVAGILVLLGLLTRLAAFALLINISVAILSTKIPILLGRAFWGFTLRELPRYGFWTAVHEARTDLCMWLGCLYLILVGAGALSIDAVLSRRSPPPE